MEVGISRRTRLGSGSSLTLTHLYPCLSLVGVWVLAIVSLSAEVMMEKLWLAQGNEEDSLSPINDTKLNRDPLV